MSNDIKTVCVYCGSSSKVDDTYFETTKTLGKLLSDHEYDLVYGGGRMGLMGEIATTMLENGRKVIGIIPSHLSDKEVAHKDLSELHVVETMHERKKMMVDHADAFLVLPGGLGTMDEFFEVFTWWQLGLHDKPIIIVNVNGYWSPLLNLIENIAQVGFCQPSDLGYLIVVDRIEDLPEALKNAPQETNDPKTKWI